ncbi:hypothetical protein CVT25_010312 [Psilocybe cyanescens]|uniref:Uncharacterized protein n=1 Tax=Psilocybe cyanescens TaxID=93625 RepID=A0A409VNP8_PSICY|nr:hypothetical protein CVT25_010312 [Psilocybe cyanescens]
MASSRLPTLFPLSILTMNTVKTPAERTREKALLSDPLANLLSPSCVECKQCKKKIKLSSKSAYDTFHWRNHRARCLKMIKKKMKATPSRRTVSSPLKAASTTKTSTKDPEPEPRRMQTPPLIDISDSEEDSINSPAIQSPQSPQSPQLRSSPSPPPFSIYLGQSRMASTLDDYILRSHPECTQQTRALSYHWQNWSWSQLKEPHFTSPPYSHPNDAYVNGDQEDEYEYRHHRGMLQHLPRPGGPGRVVADLRDQEAAHALSMLSRSR